MNNAQLQDLLHGYLAYFPDEAPALKQLSAQLVSDKEDMTSRKNMRGHFTASGFVLNPTRDAVLFIYHKAHDMWLQPGGHYEGPGNLWETAQREVAEETGYRDITLHEWHNTHLVPFDLDTHAIHARPAKNEGEHFHHDAMYVAVANNIEASALQESEVGGLRWVPFAELPNLPGLRLARFLPKLKAEGII